jgi:hypothetical protein
MSFTLDSTGSNPVHSKSLLWEHYKNHLSSFFVNLINFYEYFNKKKREETMSPCLVQQLFRQKIGIELDQGLIDEFLFPLLMPRKHSPKELLLDIKLTRSSAHSALGEENGVSAIIIPRIYGQRHGWARTYKNIIPFTPVDRRVVVPPGKTTSKFRREIMIKRNWGSIEILNELRKLNHPQIGYHITERCGLIGEDVLEFPTGPNTSEELDDMFIRLEENRLSGRGAKSALYIKHKEHEKGLVNDFLEDSLVNDNGLSWGGNPVRPFEPVLSTHY